MRRRPPRSTRNATLFPYTPRFRSITTDDTSAGSGAAAARALADGNRLILGPLLAENVGAVLAETRKNGIPLISFSNDSGAAGANVFVMGHVPEQSRSEEHTSELQSLMRISYAVFCLKKKK